MDESNEWELSKENVQPLRQGRKVAYLTSALQHTPTDLQLIKDQKDAFERHLRMNDGEDPLEVWDSYIKWTEQHFPRGVKDGNLMELLQRCLTHFKDHDAYKNDHRFVQIWIKFANFIDDPVEIYTYMFDHAIGCSLTLLYEEWANFLERLGNTKKADTIYLEGISRGAQPLDMLKLKHSEFQMRVARGITLQPRGEAEDAQTEEEKRTVLGGLKADRKHRVGTTRTGTAKLGLARPLGSSNPVPQRQKPGAGFHVFQDENAPITSAPQQTGEYRSVPVIEQLNRENEQAPGVWTKARAHQRRAVAAAAAVPAQPSFTVHEDKNATQPQHTNATVVDNHVLSARKAEKPGYMLDPIRNTGAPDERPMYCKEKVYAGTQEFSFEELRGLRYKKKKQQEDEEQRLAKQLNEMRLMREQFQKDLENMRAEQRQLIALQRQVQPSPMTTDTGSSFRNTPSFSSQQASAPPSDSFSAGLPSAPSSANSFSAPLSFAPSSASFNAPASESANSSLRRQVERASSSASTGLQNASLNSSQRTPVFNTTRPSGPSSGSGGRNQLQQSRSGAPTPESNTSKHSLTSASPTINTIEALQMVQGMYNATLECDKIFPWAPEDTEMTEAVQAPAVSAPIMVFEEMKQKPAAPAAVSIFCDENPAADQENRQPPMGKNQMKPGAQGLSMSGGRAPLFERPVATSKLSARAPLPAEAVPEDDMMGEGTEFYPHYDVTLAAVGSQDSFAAAAKTASTPFDMNRNHPGHLPAKTASTPFDMNRNHPGHLPAINLSSIQPHKMTREPSAEEMMDTATGQHSVGQQSQNAQFLTFCTTRVTPNKNDLSPIMEGGSDGSSEESKSHAASTLGSSAHAASTLGSSAHGLISTSALKTPAMPNKRQPLSFSALASQVDTQPSHPGSDPSDQHVIDTACYVPPEADEKTEALLSMSVCIDPHNPFDESTIRNFLKRINPPLQQREGYVVCNQHVPNFSGSQFVNLGMDTYQLNRQIGEGGYAKVYLAHTFDTDLDDSMDTMAIESTCGECVIKVQKPGAPWEFYICSEVHRRLLKLRLPQIGSSMMQISQGYFYTDGSCLVSDYCSQGSLLSLVNMIKTNRELMASLEPLAAYLTVLLLRMFETLHACKIIHGDVKPDNILITGFPDLAGCRDKDAVFSAKNQCLRLVDFGQAIDMSLYPPGTTFMAKVGTSGFQCIEMMTDQPWTYQTDLFGLVGTLHVLVFGQYMKVYCSQGQWHMTSSFQRKWKVELWKKLFHQLLNVPDCDQQPDLGALRREFEDHFITNLAPNFHLTLSACTRTISIVRAGGLKA
ncbi:mitotic checkpoint serine/threonine-protein kinase BUB1 beta-like [Littorina saxatilis]|uniref:mitotic checkpoint serine/threonine-protein kinase BUB1 beta-like n=1 Tax=Littorina saxatilis TaxID=31220 RepID=UPI0038B67DA4